MALPLDDTTCRWLLVQDHLVAAPLPLIQIYTQLAVLVCCFYQPFPTFRRHLSNCRTQLRFELVSSIRVQLKLLHPRIMFCLQLHPDGRAQRLACRRGLALHFLPLLGQLGLSGLQGLVLLERLQQRALDCAKCALNAVLHVHEGLADVFLKFFSALLEALNLLLQGVDLDIHILGELRLVGSARKERSGGVSSWALETVAPEPRAREEAPSFGGCMQSMLLHLVRRKWDPQALHRAPEKLLAYVP